VSLDDKEATIGVSSLRFMEGNERQRKLAVAMEGGGGNGHDYGSLKMSFEQN
jgi:hypothetical protein